MRSQWTLELSCCRAQAEEMAPEWQCCSHWLDGVLGTRQANRKRWKDAASALGEENDSFCSELGAQSKHTQLPLLLPMENTMGDFLQPSGRIQCRAGRAEHEAIPAQAGSLTGAQSPAQLTWGLAGAPCCTYRRRARSQLPSQISCVAYRATYLCRT